MASVEEIVVSGMAGRFPECNSVAEFWEALESGKDMVTQDDRRWDTDAGEKPVYTGKLPQLDSLDVDFFGLNPHQVNFMDPQARGILEVTYEALFDAGINPTSVRGSSVGVFVGVCFNDCEQYWSAHPDEANMWGLFGSMRGLLANRISYVFDFTGPSECIDTQCSSSLYALDAACASLRAGKCDSAIVAGTNVLLNPLMSVGLQAIGATSKGGCCRTFDADADGYVRSEALVAIVLQSASVAKRNYCTVVGTSTNCDGFKTQSFAHPSRRVQGMLMRAAYGTAGVPLEEVAFIECHGTATTVGDPIEVNAIADVFYPQRTRPLLLGSVKSNMGHAEGASGLCGLVKALLAMKYNKIPANLHYKTPNLQIPALVDGRVTVIDKHQPMTGDYVGINGFGFGGGNAHVILRRPGKEVTRGGNGSARVMTLPWVVGVSGRTEEAVQLIIDQVKRDPGNSDTIALLHEFFSQNVLNHLYRGVIVVAPDGTNLWETVQKCRIEQSRPVWYIVSGFGGQWPTMCHELLKIPSFRASIDECNAALKPFHLDIFDILADPDKDAIHQFKNGFVAWAAIQIALVDLLTLMGLKPDGIIGHSLGEVVSAYADGCLTARQAILAAYHRGVVFTRPEFKGGAMAAVCMSVEEVEKILPSGIDIACDNGRGLVTLSGPADELKPFVDTLREQKVFAKEVNVNGVAFHSRRIASAAPLLQAVLKEVIPEPKARSERWISTSVEKGDKTGLGERCSAEYLVNNQMTRVRFRAACAEIPPDALVIEIAPCAMMQSVLRDMLPLTASCVALLQRKEADVGSLAKAFGRLFASGGQPDLAALYPRPSFPVAASTPLLSQLVAWDHSKQWGVPRFTDQHDTQMKSFYKFTIDLNKEEDSWYKGHKVDGRVIPPATGYMVLVWQALAQLYNVNYEQLPVTFQDVHFLQATILPPFGEVELCVQLLGIGRTQFQVTEGERVVVSGVVFSVKPSAPPPAAETTATTAEAETAATTAENGMATEANTGTTATEMTKAYKQTQGSHAPPTVEELSVVNISLGKDDIDKDMVLRGFTFGGLFRSIQGIEGYRSVVSFTGKWAPFLDAMLQVLGYYSIASVLRHQGLTLPTMIQHFAIDPKNLQVTDGQVEVIHNPAMNAVHCPGVSVSGLLTTSMDRRPDVMRPQLEQMTFTPYHSRIPVDFSTALTLSLQVAAENVLISIKETQVAIFCDDTDMTIATAECLRKTVGVFADLTHVTADVNKEKLEASLAKANAKIATEVSDIGVAIARQIDERVMKAMTKDGYLLLLSESNTASDGFEVLSSCALTTGENLLLCVRRGGQGNGVKDVSKKDVSVAAAGDVAKLSVVRLENEDGFDWLSELQGMLQEGDEDVLLVVEGQDASGVVGLVNCLRLAPMLPRIRCVFVQDKSAPKFSLTEPFFAKQLSLGLTMNVYKHGSWGSYRHIPLAAAPQVPVENAYVNTTLTGELSSLRWVQGPPLNKSPDDPQDKYFHIYYTALNFRDMLLATGQLAFDLKIPSGLEGILGCEFSGRDSQGRRWMGAMPARSLATTAHSRFWLEVPDEWTLEQAATITVPYATAYYSLIMRGRMTRGESVLIHAGSGGVGQAAITLALHAGCEVFTTVSSEEKRAFLKKRFPQLDDAHIGHSRSTSFEELVRCATQGRGVDLVLNSLTGDLLHASVRCLALHGRFLEIGKLDIKLDNALGMFVLHKNVAFHGIAMERLLFEQPEHPDLAIVKAMIAGGVKSGVVKPLTSTVFDRDQLEQAVRYLTTGKHIGKVLVKVRDEEKTSDGRSTVMQPAPLLVPAMPRYVVRPGSVCIVTGGLGGLGLELTNWLVLRGARRLVLCSRTGDVSQGYKALCMLRWRTAGVAVHISTQDITTPEGVERMLGEAAEMGTVSAIFHLAVVLSDGLLENQTAESFRRVWAVKMAATSHLDLVSRSRCTTLEHFVLFSSASSGRGSPGQSNYGMSSSAAERVIELRRAAGYPGLAIQWGAVGEVGLAADLNFSQSGIRHQSVRSCLAAMDPLMTSGCGVVSSMVVSKQNAANKDGGEQAILKTISSKLGVEDLSTLPPETKLTELGMDSLMQVEIRVGMERLRGITLSREEIKHLTVARILKLVNDEPDKRPAAAAAEAVNPEVGLEARVRNAEMLDMIRIDLEVDQIMPEETIVCLESAGDGMPPLFMIHPIDGSCASLRGVARNIKRRVYGLQFTQQAPQTNMRDLAAFYIKHVRSKQAEGPYVLVGYSFGAMVAVEMASQLDRQGHATAIVSLDGMAQCSDLFTEMTCAQLEAELLTRLAKQRLPYTVDMEELRLCLMNVNSCQGRLDCSQGRGFLAERERAAVGAWLWRCRQVVEYRLPAGRPKLKTGVWIVAARDGALMKYCGDDMYGFKPIVSGELEMVEVEGDHLTFLLGEKHQTTIGDLFNIGLAMGFGQFKIPFQQQQQQ